MAASTCSPPHTPGHGERMVRIQSPSRRQRATPGENFPRLFPLAPFIWLFQYSCVRFSECRHLQIRVFYDLFHSPPIRSLETQLKTVPVLGCQLPAGRRVPLVLRLTSDRQKAQPPDAKEEECGFERLPPPPARKGKLP